MSSDSFFSEVLLTSWDKNLEYARRLVEDVPDDCMYYQPVVDMNHPAWILSHLNAYHPVITAMVQGAPFDDPKDHPFGMKSKPITSPDIYPSKSELIDTFVCGHNQVGAAVRSVSPGAFDASIPLERWQKYFANVGVALGYLMLLHESTHFGQLSAWRRVQRMPSV